ncbi:hypothetical protein MCGE09_00652 [Thaumarchaeota archaeon SCGC AB-539-E09]|nr:hypothetical protein MCGE09_00652 [Thaumarchaeota archaeon SCGC AB-539-E09]
MGLLTISSLGIRLVRDPEREDGIQFRPDLGASKQVLLNKGIIVQVEIGVDNVTAEAIRQQGNEVPESVTCSAMVDTGASCLCIDETIAERLALSRRGTAPTSSSKQADKAIRRMV